MSDFWFLLCKYYVFLPGFSFLNFVGEIEYVFLKSLLKYSMLIPRMSAIS